MIVPKFRLRLSHFLLLCAAGGAALGFWGRCYLLRTVHRQLIVNCNGYRVESYWEQTPLQRERLVYLVAFAEGPIASGNYGGDHEWGLSRMDTGIYLAGRKYSSVGQKGWVYSAYERKWGKLEPVPLGTLDDMSYQDFEQFGNTAIWRTQFKPLLDKESATFAKMHKAAPDPTAFWNRGGVP